ncbi:hypothetical protein C6P75_21455 [Burkholderia multivorans]|nr:hypothetical protein C6P75_21455 [Burkholderia multivorans]
MADARSEQGRVSASRAVIGAARRARAPVATGRDTGSAPSLRRGVFFARSRVRMRVRKLIAARAITISESIRCRRRAISLP